MIQDFLSLYSLHSSIKLTLEHHPLLLSPNIPQNHTHILKDIHILTHNELTIMATVIQIQKSTATTMTKLMGIQAGLKINQ